MRDFPPPLAGAEQDESRTFRPRFGADGLIAAIAIDAASGAVLMLAHMDRRALALTLETGKAHYYSRSRKSLWLKGETSGNIQEVVEILTDCDQDAVILKVRMKGDAVACHTGRASCFYRRIEAGGGGAAQLVEIGNGGAGNENAGGGPPGQPAM